MCGISTVCELFGLTPRAVRFYEDCGLLKSGRDRFNYRRYDSHARLRLEQIAAYRLAGLSIDDIAEIFALEDEGGDAQRACAIRKLNARLADLDGTRRHAETLIQSFSADRVMAANSETPGFRRLTLVR